jgi:hypothetical protein
VFIIWIRVYNERVLEAFSTSRMQLILHEKWRAHVIIYRVMFLQVDLMVPRCSKGGLKFSVLGLFVKAP